MWKDLILVFAALEAVSGATLYHCQEGASCYLLGDHMETTNFDFLSKFTQKQYRGIVNLTMSNASINKVDPRLKYLKNLQYLDLSHNSVQIGTIPTLSSLKTLKLNGNNLKFINMTALPQNIEVLYISHNLLVQIPKDWRSLRALKTLHLYKNPIDCDCYNVLNYDRIIKSGILVPEPVLCHSPKKYIGKDIGAVNCSLDDIMLYDEPDSGSGDIFEEANDDAKQIPFVQEKEDDDVQEDNTIIDDRLPDDLLTAETSPNSLGETLEEGSGDEGSGVGALFDDTGIIGCIENCSTPGPVGADDEEHASPLPSAIDQAKILLEDINLFKEETSSTSTTTTTTTTTLVPIVEQKMIQKVNAKVEAAPDKNIEIIGESTNTGELERASVAPSNSNAVYAIIGVSLFLAVVFAICFIKKRKAKSKKNKRGEIPIVMGEEMKPIGKPISEKQLKNAANIPEHVPLINGQNGKLKDDSPVLKTFTPLAHPETVQDEDHLERPNNVSNGISDEPVEIRHKPELLTPHRERVTIKETEIPDSIPKTPLLVHRQRNSDGEIVTTLLP